MNHFFENRQKIDDIVFAKRNKAYGAYAIRSAYGNTVLRSLSIMLLTLSTLLTLAWYAVNKDEIIENGGQIYRPIIPTKSVEVILQPKKADAPKPNASSKPDPGSRPNSSSLSTLISDSAAVNTNTILNEQQATGTQSASVSDLTGPDAGKGMNETGTGTATSENSEPLVAADTDAQFEGGLKALGRFLAENLVYPGEAKELGKGGKVVVRFVVDENGKVTRPEALNKLGYGLEEEALRVVKKIPDFKKPAMQNGKPVKVYFNLPVNFSLK